MGMRFDLRRALEIPAVYNVFQKMTRTREYRQRFMERVPIAPGARVLEVGCGPGTNVEFLPQGRGVQFVGCDADGRYIAHAQQKYGNGSASFYAMPVGGLRTLGFDRFDTVLAWGLLHHISDADLRTLADEVDQLLESGGTFCTFDPCFTDRQTLVERVLTACDRGRYVRYPEHYAALLGTRFANVTLDVWPPGTILPYSVTVCIATKG